MHRLLRYTTETTTWTDGFPLGNGRIGAMLEWFDGGERWSLNDDRCWSGGPWSVAGEASSDEDPPQVLQAVRRAVLDDDLAAAQREVRKLQFGHSQAYQPLGEVSVRIGSGAVLASRQLDLDEAVASWAGQVGDERVTADTYVSHPAQALVVEYALPDGEVLELRLVGAHQDYGVCAYEADGNVVALTTRMPTDVLPPHEAAGAGGRYGDQPSQVAGVVLAVQCAGPVESSAAADGAWLRVQGGGRVRCVLTTAVELDADRAALLGQARERADALLARDAAELRREHTQDVAALLERFDLRLVEEPSGASVDELLAASASGDTPSELVELAFHVGRYLLVAGSRVGTTATNLQGIWNRDIQPPWSSNYTVNINTEENYWLAEPLGLAELVEPLFAQIERMAESGRETARRVYGMPGWCAHHNSDVWGYTLPVGRGRDNPCWASWPMAGFWLLGHLWERLAHDPDDAEALRRYWPLLDDAVDFAMAWLVELPDGSLGTVPSTSPENSFLLADGETVAVTRSSTMDIALIRENLEHWLALAGRSGADVSKTEQVLAALARLPRPQVTERGSYPEWLIDHPEAEPRHRHQSHLYDVHPGTRVHAYDPEVADLFEAARESLRRRGTHSTGWSLAWRTLLHARLRDDAETQACLANFLKPVGTPDLAQGWDSAQAGGVYRNLFCAHPPFQIDGNYGITAGIVEMLAQSHAVMPDGVRVLDLLPVLPATWRDGRLTNVRLRGGHRASLEWRDAALVEATIEVGTNGPVRLVTPQSDDTVDVSAGQVLRWSNRRWAVDESSEAG